MQKVITINLNGNAYQLDEGGYEALVAYLERAEDQLRDNPDKGEILADLEQAIAEKCRRFLGPQKSVVATAEVEQILKEMGPVEGAPADAGAATAAAGAPASSAGGGDRKRSDGPAPKRLYLIHEGAMVAGVCNGIAAYFNIDATIVRIVFTGLALLTKGFWILAYFVLAFIIPSATTSEERAAAQGLPFNAQEVIDRAKRNYSDFANKNWGRQWRRQRREMRHRMRSMGRDWSRHEWWHHDWWPAPQPASPANYVARVAAGFMVPVLSFVNAVVFAVLLFGVASLVTTHEVFGETLPSDMPLWVGVGGIVVAYMIIAWPLHAARRASYWTVAGPHHGAVAAWDNLMSLGFAVLLTWFAYHYLAEVREVVDQIPAVWESFRRSQI